METLPEQTTFWDERYASNEFVYGKHPNSFFKQQIDQLEPGRILLPGAGEGRNAVYAARRGWTVDAFDLSSMGRAKAMTLAKEEHVTINYFISTIQELPPLEPEYDAIAMTYFHMSSDIRRTMHQKLIDGLKTGGKLILEAFTKEQLQNSSGGPKNRDMLYSLEELTEDFNPLRLRLAENLTITLSEGAHHEGQAHILRIFAEKPD